MLRSSTIAHGSDIRAFVGRAPAASLGVPGLALFGLFAADLGFTRWLEFDVMRTIQEAAVLREMTIVRAVAVFCFILLTFYSLILRHLMTGRVFVLGREARKVRLVLMAWVGVSLISALQGLFYQNDWTYLVGDFYKFVKVVLVFAGAYFSFRNQDSVAVDKFLRWLVLLLGALLLYDLIRYWDEVAAGNLRLITTTASYGSFFLSIQLYLMWKKQTTGFLVLNSSVIALVVLALIFSGTRALILVALVGITVFFSFEGKWIPRKFWHGVLAVATICLIAVVAWSLAPHGLSNPMQATISRFQLLAGELSVRHGDPYWALGSRVPELQSIAEILVKNPGNALFGFGMGSMLKTRVGPFMDWGETHFIHSGLGEIIYRAGIAGLAAFFWLNVSFLRRAYSARHRREIGILPLVLGIQQLVTSAIGFPFQTDNLVFLVYAMMLTRLEIERDGHDKIAVP